VRQAGPRFGRSGESGAPWVSDTPLRCRRDLRRLPQERRQDGELRSLLILILVLILILILILILVLISILILILILILVLILVLISILLLSARRFRRHKLRLWEAERRYCAGGSATGMSR
jgi:Flp pilus assembly protein TadB